MNGVLSGLGSSIIEALTGQSPDALQQQLTAAEQQLTLAVQVVIVLLFLSLVAQFFILIELRGK